MPIANVALPCSVILLKLITRLYIGRDVHEVEYARAALLFPTDMAFLAFAFASAALTSNTAASHPSLPEIAGFVVGIVVLAIASTFLSRRADTAFDESENRLCLGLSVANYALAIFSLVGAIAIGLDL